MHPGLQIAIQIFVRIQLWGIRGEKEEFNGLCVIFQPVLHHSGMMDPQIVQNQKDLPIRLLEQLLDEFDGIQAQLAQTQAPFSIMEDGVEQRLLTTEMATLFNAHVNKAAALVQETGYHRRDGELAALKETL
jgi:hypothetical protein